MDYWHETDLPEALNYTFKECLDHGIAVSNMAFYIAKEMKLDEDMCYELAIAGLIHDIGKILLSTYLYGDDTDIFRIEEIKYVRMHSKLSYDILQYYDFSYFVLESVLYHHENYDGSGYPENLRGEDIPIGARILRVADVFSALVSDRTYRSAFDSDIAVELMIDEVKNFDMEVFLAFQRVVHDIDMDEFLNNKIF